FACLYDTMSSRRALARAGAAGLLFGAAATMRTEALVYGAVATAIVLGYELWKSRRLGDVFARGVAVLARLLTALAIDEIMTRALTGGSVRAARTVDAAGEAGAGLGARWREAVHTSVRFGFSHNDTLLGVIFVVAIAYAAWAATHRRPTREVWAAFG